MSLRPEAGVIQRELGIPVGRYRLRRITNWKRPSMKYVRENITGRPRLA
jgi:hypothetical protein